MVPLHLRLHNFLSYRGDTELDLRGLHVACLSGNNGNGKSALLDAMTWALWGWARGRRYGVGGASPDELVCQGQADMEVALTFAAGEAVYRMVRKHARGGGRRGAARMVDLQVSDGAGFRSLTTGSVAETEGQVRRLLRMSYETFINSAFLLQGHADRFTASKPADRKKVLADILGLTLYDRLQQRARDRLHEQVSLLQHAGWERDALQRNIAVRGPTEAALAQAQQAMAELAPGLDAARAAESALDAEARALAQTQEEADRLRDAAASRRDEAARLDDQTAQASERALHHERVLSRRDEITTSSASLANAQQRLADLAAAQQRDAALERDLLAAQHAVDQAALRLSSDIQRLQERAERDLQPRAERGRNAQAALADAADDEGAIAALRQEAADRRAAWEAASRARERLDADCQRLEGELEELRRNFQMLRTGVSQCPLCGAALGADGLAHVLQEREQEGRARRAQLEAAQAERTAVATRLETERAAAADAEEALEAARTRHTGRVATLQREAADGAAAEDELTPLRAQVAELSGQLEQRAYAGPERAAADKAQAERAALAYDAAAHAEARDAVQSLAVYADLARDLRDADERLLVERAAAAELAALATARRKEARDAEAQLAEIAGRLEGAADTQRRLDAARRERLQLEQRAAETQAQEQLHRLQLERIAEQEGALAALDERMRGLQTDRAAASVLVDAFGKGGIQALLIEAALPELETQANDLLGRLTDHRMTLSLETQRQRAQGEPAETLEIRIADELGTRSYELFSGGEAFRIDFALRVALARFLASRAGAPLRTLFLDEGFGTQDPGGRERLIEAIQTIQDEFDLMLVVSHIEELKEAFPVRIEVDKDDSGSSLQVVWA